MTLIDGVTCAVTFVTPNTIVTYTVLENDFKTAVPKTYNAMIKFERTGQVERTMKFKWKVYAAEKA